VFVATRVSLSARKAWPVLDWDRSAASSKLETATRILWPLLNTADVAPRSMKSHETLPGFEEFSSRNDSRESGSEEYRR